MLPGTAPPRFRQPLLPAAAARSSASEQQQQQQQRCRAGRAEQSIIVSARRRGHSISTSLAPPLSTAPLSAAAWPLPSRPAVAASASRRAAAAAAAAAAVKAAPPSLFDPAAVSDAIKAFFSSAPSPLPQVPSLAVALAAAAALPPVRRDALAALATAVGAYALVKFFDKVATRGWLDQKLTRKLVHTLAGPLFVASWPLFSNSEAARLFAAAVPLLNGLRLILAGTGITSSEGSVRSMTRHGDRAELLRGPLYYVIALVFATLMFWRLSPVSVCAVAAMCGGDGLADIVGRRSPAKSPRIPWNRDKTVRGSAAMFVASWGFALALVWLFAGFGFFGFVGSEVAPAASVSAAASSAAAASAAAAAASSSSSAPSIASTLFASFSAQRAAASAFAAPTAAALAAVALAATAVESLPANALVDDNVSVPAVAMTLGWWLFEKSC